LWYKTLRRTQNNEKTLENQLLLLFVFGYFRGLRHTEYLFIYVNSNIFIINFIKRLFAYLRGILGGEHRDR